jgi:copper oxidase (laccase) domain-containing protein
MLSHLGRHSLEVNGGVKSVEYLQSHYGSKPEDIHVWLSASIGKDKYPILKLDNKGMKEVVHEQLRTAGILPENIIDDVADTGVHPEYFSHSEFLKGNKPEDGCHAMAAYIRFANS